MMTASADPACGTPAPRPRTAPRTRAGITAVITAAILTACGGHSSKAPAAVSTLPPTSPVPVSAQNSGSYDFQLPVDAYLLTPADRALSVKANDVLIAQCLRRYGFTLTLPAGIGHQQPPANAFRYGPITADQAAAGYQWQLDQGLGDSTLTQLIAMEKAMPQAEKDVLHGTGSAAAGGSSAPKGGCVAEARQKVTGAGGTLQDSDLALRIQSASFTGSQASPQVAAAFKAWASCMAESGYTYQTPLDPLRDKSLSEPDAAAPSTPGPGAQSSSPSGIGVQGQDGAPQPPSAKQVTVAKTDVACKQRTNLVAIWSSVESAMQNTAIEQNAEALSAVKGQIAATERNLQALVGQG